MAQYLPTTMDNEWNPHKHPDEWYAFDHLKGYNTLEKMAAFNEASVFMSDDEYEYETNLAIDKLLDFDDSGLYIKVLENDDDIISLANKVYRETHSSQ